jgi:hypothetical protein
MDAWFSFELSCMKGIEGVREGFVLYDEESKIPQHTTSLEC